MRLLDKMFDEKLPIYVINRTKNPRSEVSLTLFKSEGSLLLLVIPLTWLPICVSDQYPHSLLATSDTFRNFIAKGYLGLLTETEAEEILKDPDAVSEMERIKLPIQRNPDDAGKEVYDKSAIQALKTTVGMQEEVKVKIKEILNRDVPLQEKYLILRAEDEDLSIADLKYIIANGEGKMVSWAQERLTKAMGDSVNVVA